MSAAPQTGVPAREGAAPGATVLLLGGGGREHALAWALRRSPHVGTLVCAPGNGGIAALARCEPLDLQDLDATVALAVREGPDLVVVGPELPLALGVVDALQSRGLRVFGPTRSAAELESSKSFAKRFMQRYSIPTATYVVATSQEEALAALDELAGPVAVKADGLHAGKGVFLCPTREEAEAALRKLYAGPGAGTVVLEELLEGEELSLLLMCDGQHAVPMPPARDHKRIGEGDTGANTGGMGAYSADGMLAPEMQDWIVTHIAEPTLLGMADEGAPFTGVLFLGLMLTDRGPVVLEYNTRFGDPETEAILLRLESDLYTALEAAVEGRLSDTEFRWRPGAAASVVLASPGYPGSYPTGAPITGLAEAAAVPGVELFHAGTVREGERLLTAGGRVLCVAALAPTLSEALDRAYAAAAHIHFGGAYFRRDIGRRALTPGDPETAL